jgi:DNA polymerase (family 10)
MLSSNNITIADIFHKIASCYRYLGNDHYEQMRTYDKAAASLHHLKEDVSGDEIGFTVAIRNEIREFLENGNIRHYQRFKYKVPVALLELMEINGFGPAIVKALHEQLHIDNMEQLTKAIQSGQLDQITGISPLKIEHLKRSLKLLKPERLLLWDALARGTEILRVLRLLPNVENASIAGSLRRGCETIGDIDMVVQVAEQHREDFLVSFTQLPHVQHVIGSGWNRICAVLYNNLQLDIRMTTASSFGAALLYYTGTEDHVLHLQNLAEQKGYTLTREGLFEEQNYLAGKTEESIYEKLDLQYIPPELREGGKEVNLASRHMLPELLNHHQIKGDMRIYAEGNIDTLAHYVTNVYPHYEYMIITENSDYFYRGMNRDWLQRVDDANERLGWSFLKKGICVEILPDGSLDMPDAFLQKFDWVTAVVRQQTDTDLTERLMKACEHPLVNCIGNPSNRIIGQKAPSTINWRLLFEKAASTATALEINSLPYRLDLKYELVKKAVDKKVYLAISSAAETLQHCDYLQMGVTIARRGGCTRANVMNAMHWDAIEAFKYARKHAVDTYHSAMEIIDSTL